MSDCQHPFKSVLEDYAVLKLTGGTLKRDESTDSGSDDIRTAVQYCDTCNEVVQAGSFTSGFPIDHLNEIVTSDDSEDCPHGYDAITKDTLTYQLENGVVTTQPNLSVTICDDCNKIVDVDDDVTHLRLVTI